MDGTSRKGLGAYYTPDYVCHSLVRWAARSAGERMLDPACGDGRFLAAHPNSVGVETDAGAVAAAGERAPDATVHRGDFFEWAGRTEDRFECAAGNPPFIRYQRFSGEVRRRALGLCVKHGACFSRLTSSWGPFIVGAATVLKPGGRMAFVVPAEIGHALTRSPSWSIWRPILRSSRWLPCARSCSRTFRRIAGCCIARDIADRAAPFA